MVHVCSSEQGVWLPFSQYLQQSFLSSSCRADGHLKLSLSPTPIYVNYYRVFLHFLSLAMHETFILFHIYVASKMIFSFTLHSNLANINDILLVLGIKCIKFCSFLRKLICITSMRDHLDSYDNHSRRTAGPQNTHINLTENC